MKHVFKMALVVAVLAASYATLTAFVGTKKAKSNSAAVYEIVLVTKNTIGSNTEWTWSVTNPNPGSGTNGTLRDVSHWDVSLPASAEDALVSASYSFDGVNWFSSPIVVERDFSIKLCTLVDVLKFDAGTTGSAPTYYRAVFDTDFALNPFATSWIKNGGGQEGCNLYYYTGTGMRLD
jgi:hypothetical protein